MAADGKSNLAVIHNNLIEYEENAHKSSEKLDEVRILPQDLYFWWLLFTIYLRDVKSWKD